MGELELKRGIKARSGLSAALKEGGFKGPLVN